MGEFLSKLPDVTVAGGFNFIEGPVGTLNVLRSSTAIVSGSVETLRLQPIWADGTEVTIFGHLGEVAADDVFFLELDVFGGIGSATFTDLIRAQVDAAGITDFLGVADVRGFDGNFDVLASADFRGSSEVDVSADQITEGVDGDGVNGLEVRADDASGSLNRIEDSVAVQVDYGAFVNGVLDANGVDGFEFFANDADGAEGNFEDITGENNFAVMIGEGVTASFEEVQFEDVVVPGDGADLTFEEALIEHGFFGDAAQIEIFESAINDLRVGADGDFFASRSFVNGVIGEETHVALISTDAILEFEGGNHVRIDDGQLLGDAENGKEDWFEFTDGADGALRVDTFDMFNIGPVALSAAQLASRGPDVDLPFGVDLLLEVDVNGSFDSILDT